jgi:hypothetical protein
MTGDGNGGFVVRIPQSQQMTKNMAMFGSARFDSPEEADELLGKALADGKINVAWSYLRFAENSLPTPTTVPGVVRHGMHQGDPDVTVSTKVVHRGQTWTPVRKGRPADRVRDPPGGAGQDGGHLRAHRDRRAGSYRRGVRHGAQRKPDPCHRIPPQLVTLDEVCSRP